MSTLAIGGVVPVGELALSERVAQLETLLAETRDVAAGRQPQATGTTSGVAAPADFQSALQSATASQAPLAQPSAQEGGAGAGGEYEGMIQQAAARYGVDPAVLHGLIQQESGFDPNSQSGAGAMGLTQLMPGTASSLGVANPFDPREAIEGGARYLGQMLSQFGGNVEDALAAYNAGPGAVSQYGGVPPYSETESYVSKVLGYAEAYRQSHPATSAAGAIA